MDFLEFSDVTSEIKGCMTPGKLKMTDQHIAFKNSKTGKVEQIPSSDFDVVNFQNFGGSWGIRLFLKNGTLHRFVGFKDSDKEKIAKFFSTTYKIEMLERELSLKGWNWGTGKFNGSVLSFEVGSKSSFEIPLNHVSQCVSGKNEITMEFHQNDDAPVSLMEMRFFIPPNELAGDVDPVEAFQQQVMNKASVINVSGDAIAIFREIQCLTPRGRYDIKIFQSFFQLHGKTFDYKIPMSTVLRLFLLPHKDIRQMFFVVSLDPPIKQGQTRYHYLVLLFGQEDETSIELPFTEEELKEKYEGKLEKELNGPTYEVLGKVMKNIINRKLTGPGAFVGRQDRKTTKFSLICSCHFKDGDRNNLPTIFKRNIGKQFAFPQLDSKKRSKTKNHSGSPAVSCSYKAAAGYLYPLERGFIYIHKPPIHIRFEEVASVNFARGGGSTRSFDFEIELKSGTVHTFSSIEKEEYSKLFDFINSKKINIKNRGKSDKASYKDDFGDSDEEAAPDAYLERVKAEAQERDDGDQSDDSESTDEDFAPGQDESDVAEEYDSNHSSSSDDDEEGEGSSSEKKEKKAKKENKKEKKTKTVSEKPRKKREKKEKDENRPKRPSTAFMLWLNEHREKIKGENPGIKVTEIAKKAGEMWRELKDKSEWEGKAAKQKEEYNKAMEEYKASGGGEKATSEKSEKKPKPAPKKKPAAPTSPSKFGTGAGFKSKEYIESDDSSSDEDEDKKKEKPVKNEEKSVKKEEKSEKEEESEDKKAKVKKEESGSEEEEAASSGDDKKKKGDKRKKSSDDENDKKKVKKEKSGSEGEEEEEEEAESTPATSENEGSD